MSIEREAFLDYLAESYKAYYNVTMTDGENGLPMVFKADYFSRDERYWLTKNIPVWANETNEFVYVFSVPKLDMETAKACIDYALEVGLPRVKPHREHQYTNIKVLLVADEFDDGVVDYIRKRRFSKNYKFSLHGFTMLKSAAVDLTKVKAYPNKDSYELEKYFNKLFNAMEKSKA